jgi:hypothetical protein
MSSFWKASFVWALLGLCLASAEEQDRGMGAERRARVGEGASSLSLLSTYPLQPYDNATAVDGDVAAVANGYCGVDFLDISSPGKPRLLSQLREGGTGVALRGGFAYITRSGRPNSFRIVDIRDPRRPRPVSSLCCGNAIGIALQGDYAFLAAGYWGLVVVDIRDADHPRMVYRSYPNTFLGWTNQIRVAGNHAYLLSQARLPLAIFDISDPRVPRLVQRTSLSGALSWLASSLAVNDGYAYIVSSFWLGGNVYDTRLTVVDVRDPTRLSVVGSHRIEGGCHLALDDDRLALTSTTEKGWRSWQTSVHLYRLGPAGALDSIASLALEGNKVVYLGGVSMAGGIVLVPVNIESSVSQYVPSRGELEILGMKGERSIENYGQWRSEQGGIGSDCGEGSGGLTWENIGERIPYEVSKDGTVSASINTSLPGAILHRFDYPGSGTVTYSFKAKLGSDTRTVGFWALANGRPVWAVTFHQVYNKITVNGTAVGSYNAGKWYSIKAVHDINRSTLSVWLDGVCVLHEGGLHPNDNHPTWKTLDLTTSSCFAMKYDYEDYNGATVEWCGVSIENGPMDRPMHSPFPARRLGSPVDLERTRARLGRMGQRLSEQHLGHAASGGPRRNRRLPPALALAAGLSLGVAILAWGIRHVQARPATQQSDPQNSAPACSPAVSHEDPSPGRPAAHAPLTTSQGEEGIGFPGALRPATTPAVADTLPAAVAAYRMAILRDQEDDGLEVDRLEGVLLASGGEAVPALVRALACEGEPAARCRFMALLGEIGDARAVQALLDAAERPVQGSQGETALSGPWPGTEDRMVAIATLGRIVGREAESALLSLARSQDTARLAFPFLGRNPESRELLLWWLRQGCDADTRRASALELAGHEDAAQHLRQALQDEPDASVRDAISYSLERAAQEAEAAR